MSEASPNARPSQGMPGTNNKAYLLGYMKLLASNDHIVHEKISEWIALQNIPTQIHPTKTAACRVSSALLLQRLVRAFENRQSSSSDDAKKTAPPSVIGQRVNPAVPPNGSFKLKTSTVKATKATKSKKKLPALSVLVQRKVKVTELVQQAVQFVGSDVLKVLQVSAPSPTVVNVANTCLKILNDEKRIKEFYRVFSEAAGKDPLSIDESSSIYFGVFALQSLQSMRAQAISAYEFSHDFEMIYRACYHDQHFQICVHELNPAGTAPNAFAPDTEARNICWKMARLLALKYDHENKSHPEAKGHRRNHILMAATSIILAANIGKSIMNSEVTTDFPSGQKGTIPDDIDFVALVAAPVSDLLNFISKNAYQNHDVIPICNADIRSFVMDICILINQLGIGQRITNNVTSSSSNSLLAKAFSPAQHYFLLHYYRKIIQNLVTEQQKELKINIVVTNHGGSGGPSVRTGIVNVQLFFPMVIGEPWGIHRDAPMITSRMLCSGESSKPSDSLKDSVAIVLKMKPRPKVIKRKATASLPGTLDSVPTDNKKAKTMSLSESPKNSPRKVSQEPIDLVAEVSTSPAPRQPIDVNVGEIEPPIVNDSSELNEWTLSILSLSLIKPTDSLLTYIGEYDRIRGNGSSCLQEVIVPVLNRGVIRIQGAIRSSKKASSEDLTTKLTIGRRDGQVYVNGQVDQNIQLCASVFGFYYYSLEAIIHDQIERMDFLGSFGSHLQSGSFHRALLACCYSCILKAVGVNEKLQVKKTYENITINVLMDTIECDPFTFLKVVEAFCRALVAMKESTQKQIGPPIIAGLPRILHKYMQKIETQLIDSVLWRNSSTMSEESVQPCFPRSVKTLKSLPGAWPPDILEPILPEEIADVEGDSSKSIDVRYKPSFGSSSEANFLSFVLRKLLKCIFFRIRALCAALNISNESNVHTQILVAFRYLLRYHISILNDRHVDQLLLCTIYGVSRMMKIRPIISFAKVIDAYFTVRQDQGDRACRLIVRHVKLTSLGDGNRSDLQGIGNIVVFYNTVYIPKMQKYFLGSKYLKTNAELYQKKYEKKEISEKFHVSRKRNSAQNVPNNSYTHTTGATVAAGATAAASTQCLKSTKSQINSETIRSENKSLVRKNSSDVFLVQRNGSVGNSVASESTNDPSSLNTVQISRTNGVTPRVCKPSTSIEPDPIARAGTVFESKEAHIEAEDASKVFGKSDTVVKENSASARVVSGAENSETSSSTWLNWLNSSNTAASEKISSPTEKPTPSNDKNKMDLSVELDENEQMDTIAETDNKNGMKTNIPNGAVCIEGTISGSLERGTESTGGNKH